LECYKKVGEEETMVKTCEAGDVFGELSLLYNCPRAASVESRENSVVWKLDRETFNHIVKDASIRRRERYEEILSKVPLLESISQYERSQISDALIAVMYDPGTDIITQGESGDRFYIVEEGTAKVYKDGLEMMVLGAGEYFGELALLRDEPRAATVTASTQLKVLFLERASFKRLLGSVGEILGSKAKTRYEKRTSMRLSLLQQ